ncbi:KilA-N domain-containing protein [Pseudomonas sp. G11]|uniref:KilA-N domain-containing protein n=1 Tax=Pseudomonas sp. G11 TaxID=528343 RepID=UPI002402BA5A|nr:KilA-N domain-containing protein [Pseudomonas sp. G11]WEX16255.1 KilA-N domain-containing protein [Pseudomonas sp. G11]
MNNVIRLDFEGQLVRFNTDGWINATEVAKRFGKKPVEWLRLPATERYIAALAKAMHLGGKVGLSHFGLVVTERGGKAAGTWLHPKLGVRFAQWLDDDFAVWCDTQIDALLRGFPSAMGRFNHACKRLDDRQSQASASGRDLAEWKREKPGLIAEVERGRNQLQMILALDNPENHSLQASS